MNCVAIHSAAAAEKNPTGLIGISILDDGDGSLGYVPQLTMLPNIAYSC